MKVIDVKTAEWLNDSDMSKYLRPTTLFGAKFESYLNQKPVTNTRTAAESIRAGRDIPRDFKYDPSAGEEE